MTKAAQSTTTLSTRIPAETLDEKRRIASVEGARAMGLMTATSVAGTHPGNVRGNALEF
jgi:hypothetical protein